MARHRRADRIGICTLAGAMIAIGAWASPSGWARGGEEGTDLGSANGLNYRVNQSNDFMGTGFNSFVSCLDGDAAVSGGVKISGSGLQGRMGATYPDTEGGSLKHGAKSWRTSAQDLTQPQTDIGFYAVCKKSGAGGLKYRSVTRNIKPGQEKRVRAACPDGYRVIGGGLGSASPVVLASVPFDGGDKGATPDDGWRVRALSDFGVKTEIEAIAVCLKAGMWRLSYRTGGAAHNIYLSPNSTVLFERTCPVGASVIGGGGEVLGPPTNGRVHESHPGGIMVAHGAWAVGLTNLTASTVTGRTYAICRK